MIGFQITPMVRNLLILNIGIYAIMIILSVDLMHLFGLPDFSSPTFQPYQLFTHMFIHSSNDFRHIFGNMIGLLVFGPMLEKFMGSNKFLLLYLICGFGAAIFSSGIHYYELAKLENLQNAFLADPSVENLLSFIRKYNEEYIYHFISQKDFQNFIDYHANVDVIKHGVQNAYSFAQQVPSVGASGAIFGILIAFAMFFPNTEIMLLFLPIPIKAKYFVTLYALYELYSGLHPRPGDNVGHFAHIGGMLIGFLMIKYWNKSRTRFY